MSEIRFVDELPETQTAAVRREHLYARERMAMREHPGKWAVLVVDDAKSEHPRRIKIETERARRAKSAKEQKDGDLFVFRQRTVSEEDEYGRNDWSTRVVTLYGCYEPTTDEKDESNG